MKKDRMTSGGAKERNAQKSKEENIKARKKKERGRERQRGVRDIEMQKSMSKGRK